MVEKRGFIAFQKDVQIEPAKVTEERATLVPSPDFVDAYRQRQRGCGSARGAPTGVAVAGVAVAVWAQADANRLYGNDTTPDTFLYARAKLLEGDRDESAHRHRLPPRMASALRSDIEQRQLLSGIGAGVGGAAAVAAAWFWIAGDDPGRYNRYREGSARLDVVPVAGGALAAITLGF